MLSTMLRNCRQVYVLRSFLTGNFFPDNLENFCPTFYGPGIDGVDDQETQGDNALVEELPIVP